MIPEKKKSPLEWGFDKDPLLILCLKHKVCCVTFKTRTTEAIHLHHVDRIGMGHDRRALDDSKHRKMMLSAEKHEECHRIGQKAFDKKYKVYGVIYDTDEIDPLEVKE